MSNSGYQHLVVCGYVGKGPEQRNERAPVMFPIATSEKWTNPQGEEKSHTEWHTIHIFGKAGQAALKYVEKGQIVLVEGKVKTHSWEDSETGEKRYRSFVHGHRWQYITGPRTRTNQNNEYHHDDHNRGNTQPQRLQGDDPSFSDDNLEDDIPF